jgi:microcystin-dependent protein
VSDVGSTASAVEVDTSGLAETLAVSAQDEWDPVVARQGEVTAVTPGVAEASVCSVSVGGAAAIDNVRHLCDTPEVGDTVWLLQVGPMRLIIGVVGGSEKVGAIKWIGGTGGAPLGWWPCDGRSTTGYPKLAARYGATIPDLSDRFVVGSGPSHTLGTTGGAATVTLDVGEVPTTPHTHTIPNHAHTQTAHTHAMADHNHGIDANDTTEEAPGGGLGLTVATAFANRVLVKGTTTDMATGTDGAAYNTGSGGAVATANDGGGGATNSPAAGSPTAHENQPPWFALLAIIKFG